jgi:hypothetical protein
MDGLFPFLTEGLEFRRAHASLGEAAEDEGGSGETTVSLPVLPLDDARAAENIAQWQSYLPADCVDKMVEMGWHVTT